MRKGRQLRQEEKERLGLQEGGNSVIGRRKEKKEGRRIRKIIP